jgi:ADP-ribose pyrophosphatase
VTTSRRETIYQGRVFRVERDRVTLPSGRAVTLDIVRHRGSVVLLPETKRGSVVLIRQYRHVLGRWIWELPAGTLEPGEAPARAARRECEEEIGLRPGRVERLGVYYPTPGFCDERMIFYACRDLTTPRRRAAPDADEQIEPRTFSMREAWSLVARGEVVDMKTTLGLAMLAGRVPLSGVHSRGKRGTRSARVRRD